MTQNPPNSELTPGAITCENLSLVYPGGSGISGINLDFGPGITAIVGNNGAGKTTLLELIAGLRIPTAGNISLFGRSPSHWRSSGINQVGVALQDGRPYPSAKPVALLNYLDHLYANRQSSQGSQGSQGSRSRPSVDFLIEAFALTTKTFIKNLSGGELQRLKCAAALIAGAPILILDEPTAGLDPQGRRDLYNVLARVVPEQNTLLVSTHILEDLEVMDGRVIALKSGQVAYDSNVGSTTSAFHMTFNSRANIELTGLRNALAEGVVIAEKINGRYSIASNTPIDAAFITTVMNFCAQIGAEVSQVNVRERGGVLAEIEDLLLDGGSQ
jgi:ABC-2 type transport system ATP-binding protein